MRALSRSNVALCASLAFLTLAGQAWAGTITANCTGMLNFDIYTFDSEKDSQDVKGIGASQYTQTDDFITLVGDFGEYKFDLAAGTLYLNGNDTGVYCTYTGL